MRRIELRMLCLLLAVAAGAVNGAELVINGDFEKEVETFVTWPGYVGGDNPADVPDWFGQGGRGINPVQPGPTENPPNPKSWTGRGGRGINPVVDPNNPTAPFRDNGDNDTTVAFLQTTSAMAQLVNGLTIGSNYVLSFEFNARNCCGDVPVPSVSFDGNKVPSFPGQDFPDGGVPPVGDINPWYEASIPFTANSNSVSIEISTQSLANGDSTFIMDNLSFKSQPNGPNLIANGDFEADAETFVLWPGYVGDGARLAPFRDNGNNTTAVAFLQGGASLEQDVAGLEIRKEYTLSLDFNARNCCGGAIPTAELYLDDQFISDFPGEQHQEGIQPVGGNNPWYHFETTFTAEKAASLLSIRTMPFEGGDSTLVVDNVSIRNKITLPGDFDGNGLLNLADIELLSAAVRGGANPGQFDLNSDKLVNQDDRKVWVENLKRTYFGDANFDGEFNSSDFVAVFTSGQYEDTTAENSNWSTGDWNGDREFTSGDFVLAFQGEGYEKGPRPAANAVPEPCAGLLFAIAFGGFVTLNRPRRS